jgi:hypothetical protein
MLLLMCLLSNDSYLFLQCLLANHAYMQVGDEEEDATYREPIYTELFSVIL